jgi:hypothetical protein
MASTATPYVADARLDPPWSDCGDPRGADLGRVFARPVANGALALSFDRAGRRHALTLFAGAQLGSDIVIYGRRFSVVRETAAAR